MTEWKASILSDSSASLSWAYSLEKEGWVAQYHERGQERLRSEVGSTGPVKVD